MSRNYFEAEGTSATLLKAIIQQSPVHAIERMQSFKPSASMVLGTAVHASLLEADRYDKLIAVSPNVDKRTKEGKATYAEFVASTGDKTVITEDQQDMVEAMTMAVMDHPQAKSLLEGCDKEVEKFFEYEDLKCKAKIDCVHCEGFIVDIKTTKDASPDAFSKQSANLLYHLQMAWYAKAVGRSYKDCDCYIIAVENTAPHGVAVYQYDHNALEFGWKLAQRAVRQFKEYVADLAIDGKSLPYGSESIDLFLPAWAERI